MGGASFLHISGIASRFKDRGSIFQMDEYA
jgi:hypothetical protein